MFLAAEIQELYSKMAEKLNIPKKTRVIKAGRILFGGEHPLPLQSMAATRTQDIDATVGQINLLKEAGADFIRIAIDSKKDVEALKEIHSQVCSNGENSANLVVDLQENYRLAKDVAPYIVKFRYNPGHLHHHQKEVSVRDKVRFLTDIAKEFNLAIRVGVNFGSLDPKLAKESNFIDPKDVAIQSARMHCEILEELSFQNYLVSLKSSHPESVEEINKKFSELMPQIPLHLGVTEAGLLPDAEIKSRIGLEPLLAAGIGDTLRVSLTLPNHEKYKEIDIARKIVQDVNNGKFINAPKDFFSKGLNVISCPSCSRVENLAFVELAEKVKEVTSFAKEHKITIAVMGCRVNGPGETDSADLGLWCGPNFVNLKKGSETLGAYPYDQVVNRLLDEVNKLISQK